MKKFAVKVVDEMEGIDYWKPVMVTKELESFLITMRKSIDELSLSSLPDFVGEIEPELKAESKALVSILTMHSDLSDPEYSYVNDIGYIFNLED